MELLDFIFISLFIWQSVFGLWILFIWVSKNFKFQKSPNLNINEVVKTSTIEETKVKKNMGPIEVDVKSNVIMDTKSDEYLHKKLGTVAKKDESVKSGLKDIGGVVGIPALGDMIRKK